jgi:hypothetical protein
VCADYGGKYAKSALGLTVTNFTAPTRIAAIPVTTTGTCP